MAVSPIIRATMIATHQYSPGHLLLSGKMASFGVSILLYGRARRQVSAIQMWVLGQFQNRSLTVAARKGQSDPVPKCESRKFGVDSLKSVPIIGRMGLGIGGLENLTCSAMPPLLFFSG
jgi:hypothetical protein